MREIVETRSILGTGIRQRMTGTAEWVCAKFTWKTCLVLCSYEFACQGQRSKVRVTRNKKRTVHSEHPAVLTEWNAFVVDNVAQAANATSRSLVRGVFSGLPSACGMRWAWRATTGLCHAFFSCFLLNTLKHFCLSRPVPSLECNGNCSCDPTAFTPVCGSDGRNYFSPCYAGCQIESRVDNKTVT